MDDSEIERLAVEELQQEAKRAAERAKEMGAAGWLKPKVPVISKRFLNTTLLSTLPRRHHSKRDWSNRDNYHHSSHDVENDHGKRKHSSSSPYSKKKKKKHKHKSHKKNKKEKAMDNYKKKINCDHVSSHKHKHKNSHKKHEDRLKAENKH